MPIASRACRDGSRACLQLGEGDLADARRRLVGFVDDGDPIGVDRRTPGEKVLCGERDEHGSGSFGSAGHTRGGPADAEAAAGRGQSAVRRTRTGGRVSGRDRPRGGRGWQIRAEPAAETRGFWAVILGVALEGATRSTAFEPASAEAAVDLVLNLYLEPDRAGAS
jgi:hypothetical protein